MRTSARGFILPTSLLVVTLLTVMLTAAFVLVSAEYRSTDNASASARALAIAQAGISSYFAANRGLQPTDQTDSVRYTFTGGYADVVAKRMSNATSGVTPWVIRSIGTTTDPLLSGQITAKRVLAQMATLNPVSLPARAALVAVNGVDVLSTGGNPIDGDDWNGTIGSCTPPAGAGADTVGVSTYPGGYASASSGSGNPPPSGEGTNGVESLASANAVYDSTHIDWAEVVAGNFTPDYIASATNLPPMGASTWEVGYTPGDLTLPGASTFTQFTGFARAGVLIVGGNLTLSNYTHWDGIIIVGGRLITPSVSTQQFLVHGFVVTGLNCITSTCPGKNQVYRGGSVGGPTYRAIAWSYCWARKGIQLLTTMQPKKNTTIDNWASY